LGVVIVGAYFLAGMTIFRSLIWMFGIATFVNPYLSDFNRGIRFQFKFPVIVSLLLGLISVYSIQMFPYIKSTWGGGAPLPAYLYLSKDSPIFPAQKMKVSLLEGADSGFYVVFENDKKTTYIPKAEVTAMEFMPPSN
jgi:hypothetical protein